MRTYTKEEIEAARSPAGGYTKVGLAALGVYWPPPKGWQEMLMKGIPLPEQVLPPPLPKTPIRPEQDAHALLRDVVLAVITSGHGDLLWEFPDVLAYFGGQLGPNGEGRMSRVVSDTCLPDAPF